MFSHLCFLLLQIQISNGNTVARKTDPVLKSMKMIRSHEKVIEFNSQISSAWTNLGVSNARKRKRRRFKKIGFLSCGLKYVNHAILQALTAHQ